MLSRLPKVIAMVDDSSCSAVARVDAAQSVRQVERVLRKLSGPERDVVRLCVLAELSYAAAAALLDVPVGTVRSRLARACARLRAAGDPDFRTGPIEPDAPVSPTVGKPAGSSIRPIPAGAQT